MKGFDGVFWGVWGGDGRWGWKWNTGLKLVKFHKDIT